MRAADPRAIHLVAVEPEKVLGQPIALRLQLCGRPVEHDPASGLAMLWFEGDLGGRRRAPQFALRLATCPMHEPVADLGCQLELLEYALPQEPAFGWGVERTPPVRSWLPVRSSD